MSAIIEGENVYIFCRTDDKRVPVMYISKDNGETWDIENDIYVNRISTDLGYPSTVEMSDGSLLTVYYQRYKDDKHTSILGTNWKI